MTQRGWCNGGADVYSYSGWFGFEYLSGSRYSVKVSRITVHPNIVINKVSEMQ
jgi:hypothetical protein